MNGMVLLLALTVPSIEYGWRPGPNGLEYIIQMEEAAVVALGEGLEISSDVPPEAAAARRVVIRLQQQEEAAAGLLDAPSDADNLTLETESEDAVAISESTPPESTYPESAETQGLQYGWRPAADGRLEYVIQMERSVLDVLQSGHEVMCHVLPEVTQVERYVVRVGSGPVPRIGVAVAGAQLAQSRAPRQTTQAARAPSAPPQTGGAASRYGDEVPATGAATTSTPPPASAAPRWTNSAEDPRFRDPYARNPASAPANPTRQTTSTLEDPAAVPNRLDPNPAYLPDDRPYAPTTSTVPSRLSSTPQRTTVPSAVGEPWPEVEGDPDDETTAARADAWNAAAGNNVTPPDRWASDPRAATGTQYPAEDWRTTTADRSAWNNTTQSVGNRTDYSGVQDTSRSPPPLAPHAKLSTPQQPSRTQTAPVRVARSLPEDESTTAYRGGASPGDADYELERSTSGRTPQATVAPKPAESGGDLLKELVLFASLGVNVVAVMIARQYYLRYRMAIREMRDTDTMSV